MIKYKPSNKEKLMGCVVGEKFFLTNGVWFVAADSMTISDSGVNQRIRDKKPFTFEYGEMQDSDVDLARILGGDFSEYKALEDTKLDLRGGAIVTSLLHGGGFYVAIDKKHFEMLSKLPVEFFGGGKDRLVLVKSLQNGEILGGCMPVRVDLPSCLKKGGAE